MTTVTAVKRALEEARADLPIDLPHTREAFTMIATSPTALTILANHLSDRGEAGNRAAEKNLRGLDHLREVALEQLGPAHLAALDWAIDQLTPPEPAMLSHEEGAARMMRLKQGIEE